MKSEQDYELFLSSISHEIRNPVTLIQSYLQLLASAHPEVRRYEYWDNIREEMRHLRSLLEDLSAFNNGLRICRRELDFGLWLTGYAQKAALLLRRILRPAPASPSAGLENKTAYPSDAPESRHDRREFYEYPNDSAYDAVAETSAYDAAFRRGFSENAGIRFSCCIAPDLPQMSLDPDKLRQALDNLIRNAAEAHSSQVTLSAYREQNFVILEISDNGDGIASEDLPRLFTPFVSHKPEGTGLGLAISERIIKAHCGTITVRSEPHHLTVFRIALPV